MPWALLLSSAAEPSLRCKAHARDNAKGNNVDFNFCTLTLKVAEGGQGLGRFGATRVPRVIVTSSEGEFFTAQSAFK
jgi:hypothetical protein